MKEDARPAVPALIAALKDRSNQTVVGTFTVTIQAVAAEALGRASAGSYEAVPALTEALTAADSAMMCKAVAFALGEVGAEALPAAPLLRALLKAEDVQLRQTAERALRNIEGESAAVL
jgi:HEAT repeat protein